MMIRLRPGACRHMVDHLFVEYVMGRGRDHVRRPALPDHEVAVADAGVEPEFLAPDRIAEVLDEDPRLLGRDLSRAVVAHKDLRRPHVEVDEVAPKGDVPFFEGDPHAVCLYGGAARIVLFRVIAEERHAGDVAARRKTRGHGNHLPAKPLLADPVDGRLPRGLKRGLPAQLLTRKIGHPIADNHQVFHRSILTPVSRVQRVTSAECAKCKK